MSETVKLPAFLASATEAPLSQWFNTQTGESDMAHSDTANNADRVLAALAKMVLEYQAARYVLEHASPRPADWAIQLRDYRKLPTNQKRVTHSLDAVRAVLLDIGLPDEKLQSLAEVMEPIAPHYPSAADILQIATDEEADSDQKQAASA